MASGSPKRTRSSRVATLKLPPGTFERAFKTVQRTDVLLRIALCLVAALALWGLTGGWTPPFAHRLGDIPPRNVVARVSFQTPNEQATELARQEALRHMDVVYRHDPRRLVELRQALKDKVFLLLSAKSYEEADPDLWREFQPVDERQQQLQETADAVSDAVGALAVWGLPVPLALPAASELQERAEFVRFQQAFQQDANLAQLERALQKSMAALDQHGLLESLQHPIEQGNQTRIRVFPTGSPNFLRTYEVDEVRISQAALELEKNLRAELPSPELASHIFAWLKPKLPVTLTFDVVQTQRAAEKLLEDLPPATNLHKAGDSVLARAGEPMTAETVALLRHEHEQFIAQMGPQQLLYYSFSKFGMYIALYTVCGFYILFRRRSLLHDLIALSKLLLLIVVTVTAAWYAAPSRFELIPLLLFSMTVVIVHDQELALLLSAVVALLAALTLGHDLVSLVVMLASMATAVLLLRHVRSRTKLIYVGLWTAAAAVLTLLGAGILSGRLPEMTLLREAAWGGGCVVAAGLLMTGLLPFIERFFDVQTDLSLLELGDAGHPLLQELVRRAPGTYNHSINVASISQAAAEAIGANGLLVRVGAYFHDIGKMLKPGYFVENQGVGDNRHESLLPAMSTLIIIAHVKDGADLARQHNLPNSIIDFIQQHHGTTLVEYFYRRASEQRGADPEAASVDEGTYRYPGPKPQTREAAVLMLADAVESAGRALVDPAPARIENLVEEIAMKRLLDGQFDECGLTLQELRTVQDSLIKSLTAVYHGRIKYPDQQTA